MKKFFKNVLNGFVFIMTGKGEVSEEAVNAGILEY